MGYSRDASGKAMWRPGAAAPPRPSQPTSQMGANPFAQMSAPTAQPNPFAAPPVGGTRPPDVGWEAARLGVGVVGATATAINPVIGGVVTGVATPIVNLLEGLFRR